MNSISIYWLRLLLLILIWLNESKSQNAIKGSYLYGSLLEGTSPNAYQRGNLNNDELQLPAMIEDQLLKVLVSDLNNDRPVCRSSYERKIKDHFLPIGLFSLDSCARCYGYILDVPAFFDPYSKWNRTEIPVPIPSHLSSNTLLQNITITVLKNDHLNITVCITTIIPPLYSNWSCLKLCRLI